MRHRPAIIIVDFLQHLNPCRLLFRQRSGNGPLLIYLSSCNPLFATAQTLGVQNYSTSEPQFFWGSTLLMLKLPWGAWKGSIQSPTLRSVQADTSRNMPEVVREAGVVAYLVDVLHMVINALDVQANLVRVLCQISQLQAVPLAQCGQLPLCSQHLPFCTALLLRLLFLLAEQGLLVALQTGAL